MTNSGGISQRKDGLFVVRITDPATGKRVARYAKTEPEARKLLRSMQARVHNGERAADGRQTVRAYAEWWLEHRAGRGRSGATVNEYQSRLTVHVLPVIGGMKLGQVTELDVEDVLDGMARAGKSISTIRGTRNVLGAMFTDAVRGKVINANPVRGAVLPEGAKPATPRAVPTDAEVAALLDAVEGTEVGRIVLLVTFTGCRIGEALGMRWDDVDLDAGRWTVGQTLTRDRRGRTIIGETTKGRAARSLLLEPVVVEMLREQRIDVNRRRLAARVWNDDTLVWPTSWGTHRDESNTREELHEAAPDWPYTFHELRHYLASIGILDGDVTSVSKFLGHKSTRTTMDVYAHLMDDASKRIGEAISRRLAR